MSGVEERARLAAQSILENESLTSGLDDASGSALLAWGVARAQAAAAATASMGESEAGETLDENMRSLRRLLKSVSRWVQSLIEGDAESAGDHLNTAIEHAAAVYGDSFAPPDDHQILELGALTGQPPLLINELRALLEPPETGQPNATTPDRSAALLGAENPAVEVDPESAATSEISFASSGPFASNGLFAKDPETQSDTTSELTSQEREDWDEWDYPDQEET